jgi:hypothetical protein
VVVPRSDVSQIEIVGSVMFLAGGTRKGGISEGRGARGFLVVSLPDAGPA